MNNNKYEQAAALIEEDGGENVEFGSPETAPSQEWIEKAQDRLGVKFPPSYLWFLNNYGGGEIFGDEIFSIYGMEFETVFGGDIVFQYLTMSEAGSISATEIPFCETGMGELFVFESTEKNEEGEFPIYRKVGDAKEHYASDVADFFIKHLSA